MMRSSAVICLLVGLSCGVVVSVGAEEPGESAAIVANESRVFLERARATLGSGDPAAALSIARAGLELAPDSVDLVVLAHRAALAAEKIDAALWYASAALRGDSLPVSVRDELTAAVTRHDPLLPARTAAMQAFASTTTRVAGVLERAGMYANAIDLLTRVAQVGTASRAGSLLDRLLKNPRAVAAARQASVVVPATPVPEEQRRALARQDAQHRDWDSAWRFRSDHYVVLTNIGYQVGRDVTEAMEAMNGFYRSVFPVSSMKGIDEVCTIRVYASRAEFDRRHPDTPRQVRGMFRTADRSVITYDPRTDGRPFAALWSTLFHEAAHQFTAALGEAVLPGWLSEGTACLFEGARILPGPVVEARALPERRLAALSRLLAREGPGLIRKVLAHRDAQTFPADYYAVAWGLVQFLDSYETMDAELAYRPLYRELLASYREGAAGDPVERFVEIVIGKSPDPAVRSIEDFEKRFRVWASGLHELVFGPEAAADGWLAMARRQRAAGAEDRAMHSYRMALHKRSNDIVARLELAEVAAGLGLKDRAVLEYRRAAMQAKRASLGSAPVPGLTFDAAGVVQEVGRRIDKLQPGIAALLDSSRRDVATTGGRIASQYVERGLPRRAIALLDDIIGLVGGDATLRALRDSVARETGTDTRSWRRLLPVPGSADWDASTTRWGLGGDAARRELRSLDSSPAFAFYRCELPATFRGEVTLRRGEAGPRAQAGLVIGSSDRSGVLLVGVSAGGPVFLGSVAEEPVSLRVLGEVAARDFDGLRLAVEVRQGEVEVFLGETSLGVEAIDDRLLTRRIGVFAQTRGVGFTDLRVRY